MPKGVKNNDFNGGPGIKQAKKDSAVRSQTMFGNKSKSKGKK